MSSGQQQDAESYVVSGTITFPLTIGASNNQFAYNSAQYTIPSGTYKTNTALATAINKATGSPSFHSLVSCTADSSARTKIRMTSQKVGTDTKTFATGSSNDALASLAITTATAINATQSGVDGPKSSNQGTTYSAGILWDGTRYISNPAQVGEDNI